MHIAEGVLSPAVLCVGAAITCIGTALGCKKLTNEKILTCGLLSALFFVASLIHIPIGVSSAHLIATGLLGIFLGLCAYPAMLVALALQALFFQFGGLTVLGVNTATMATSAYLAGLLFHAVYKHNAKRLWIAGFLAGFFGVLCAALATSCALAFSAEGFLAAAWALCLAHIPVMIAEGCLTACTVTFIARVRPEILAYAS